MVIEEENINILGIKAINNKLYYMRSGYFFTIFGHKQKHM